MAQQRDDSHWSSFTKARSTWIHEADRIMADCGGWTAAEVNRDDASRRHWRRSAKLYERAADFYRRADLGLAASLAWETAATCYFALGMHEDADRCQHKADTIPLFWNDDDTSSSEN
jgi:hypothetical protein